MLFRSIEFEAGDLSRPIWTGCWWAEDGLPKDRMGRGADAGLKILRSESGLMVALDDDGETITLSDKNGVNLVSIRAREGAVTVQAAAGIAILAPGVQLGAASAGGSGGEMLQPAVLGDQLMGYLRQLVSAFNSHVHPGQVVAGTVTPITPAPPLPPFTPPSPGLITGKVKICP